MIPTCHRTLSGTPAQCIGSRCALWLPDRTTTPEPTKGRCADNPNAAPWVDPAKEPE